MSKASIRDVALKAGVSAMTVSRFLNGSGYVGKSAAEKIEEAISDLRYRPNQIARSLQTRRTRNIAVLLGNVSSPMSALTIKGIESVSFSNNYNLLVCNTDFSAEKECAYLEMLMQKQIDGMILAPCSDNVEPLHELSERGITLLFIERHVPGIEADYISFDFRRESRNITSHLLEQGCTRIAVICREADVIHQEPHLKGFYDALSAAGIIGEQTILHCRTSPASGYDAMRNILDTGVLPDAVYVTSSLLAAGVLRCCRDKNVNIPEDLLMACFDSFGEYDDLVRPGLTCNELPAFELGVRGAELLLQRLTRTAAPTTGFRHVVLPGKLRMRESTYRPGVFPAIDLMTQSEKGG